MQKFFQASLILLAVVSVAVGDIFIKKAATGSSFIAALVSKWVFVGVLLYILQIVLFAWMFVKGWELSIVGIMQIVFYTLIVLVAGHLLFKEQLNAMQIFGIALAIVGIVIANVFKR